MKIALALFSALLCYGSVNAVCNDMQKMSETIQQEVEGNASLNRQWTLRGLEPGIYYVTATRIYYAFVLIG